MAPGSKVDSRVALWAVARRRLASRQTHDVLTAFVFLFPSIVVFMLFSYYGLFFNLYISLTSWNFLSATKRFIGLENYQTFFEEGLFLNVLRNTTVFSISSTVGALVIGLGLALLLNRQIRGRAFARTILFAPYVGTLSVFALLWRGLYEPRFGLVNEVLGWFGIAGPEWMRSAQWAMPGLIIMDIWRTAGYCMVLYLAGLQSIPPELLEAARIDGASSWRVLRHITLPLLSPTTFFLVIVRVIASFKIFTAVNILTDGGPLNSTQVFTFHIYQYAFKYFRAGYAAAVSTLFFVILLVLTIVQMRLQRRWVHYY